MSDKEPTEVEVWYTVPVRARVDLESREVTSVVMFGGEIELADNTVTSNVTLPNYGDPVRGTVARRAIEIAEQADWPAWDSEG